MQVNIALVSFEVIADPFIDKHGSIFIASLITWNASNTIEMSSYGYNSGY